MFTDAALILAYVTPTYSTQSTAQTFSVVVLNNSTDTVVRFISVDLPNDFTLVSVAATSFSAGTWGTPSVGAGNVITVATTDNTAGNALGQNGWARFKINATTSITAHTANNDANRFIVNIFSNNIGTTGNGIYRVGVWVQNSPIPLANRYTATFLKRNTTTLSAAINGLVTTIPVASGAGIANGDVLLIDNEQMRVIAGGGTTSLTVERDFNGSSNANHASGATVDITTTLSANITAAQTTITVNSGASIANNDVLLVDAEQMQVTAGGGTTSLTVTRGFNGSTAATHLGGLATAAQVQVATSPTVNVGSPTTYKMRITKTDTGREPTSLRRHRGAHQLHLPVCIKRYRRPRRTLVCHDYSTTSFTCKMLSERKGNLTQVTLPPSPLLPLLLSVPGTPSGTQLRGTKPSRTRT